MNTTVMLLEKTVCLSLTMTSISSTKCADVKKVMKEDLSVNQERLKLMKKYIDSDKLRNIERFDLNLRNAIEREYSLPCSVLKSGIYLIPLAKTKDLSDFLDEKLDERSKLIDEFVKEYDLIKEQAKIELGVLFDERDYPPNIRDYFKMNYSFVSFSAPQNLPEDLKKKQEEKLQKFWQDIESEIKQNFRALFLDVVETLNNKLEKKNKKGEASVRADSFNMLYDFIQKFCDKKVVEDPEIELLMTKAKTYLSNIDPKLVRSDEAYRAKLQTQLRELKEAIGSMVEIKGVRKFNFNETDKEKGE